MKEELWYKNTIIYGIDVHRFYDSNGDGIGDFQGLIEKLDYISDLGVTCVWLLPFFPSPYRDNGYDVQDFYGVDPKLGTLDDFITFVRKAGERSIRVMIDLVMDHTSDQHPWFISARHDPESRYRGYYAWTKQPPPVPLDEGPMFPGEQKSVWTFDETAQAYYHHRFYDFEPDLNVTNPQVLEEMERVMDFWLSFGVSGFRIDAASHMIEGQGLLNTIPGDPHGILKNLRSFAVCRREDVALLGEADVAPEKIGDYFGNDDELNLLFNFVQNNYLYLSLTRELAEPLVQALTMVPAPPAGSQYTNFLRNLDEVDLERLPEADREEVFKKFAPRKAMRIYNRGIRRRLAPMLDDPRRLNFAFSLLFALPGCPMFVYGDEIGMGEDLSLSGRNTVRTPMQWSDELNGGFSSAPADQLETPVLSEGPFGYHKVNVKAERENSDSTLNWVRLLTQLRRQCPEISLGNWQFLEVDNKHVLALRYSWKDGVVITLHNLSRKKQHVELHLQDQRGRRLIDLLRSSNRHDTILESSIGEQSYSMELDAFAHGWYRVSGERFPE